MGEVSYQRYQFPASFPRSQDARDQSLVRDQWGRFQVRHREVAGLLGI